MVANILSSHKQPLSCFPSGFICVTYFCGSNIHHRHGPGVWPEDTFSLVNSPSVSQRSQPASITVWHSFLSVMTWWWLLKWKCVCVCISISSLWHHHTHSPDCYHKLVPVYSPLLGFFQGLGSSWVLEWLEVGPCCLDHQQPCCL